MIFSSRRGDLAWMQELKAFKVEIQQQHKMSFTDETLYCRPEL